MRFNYVYPLKEFQLKLDWQTICSDWKKQQIRSWEKEKIYYGGIHLQNKFTNYQFCNAAWDQKVTFMAKRPITVYNNSDRRSSIQFNFLHDIFLM